MSLLVNRFPTVAAVLLLAVLVGCGRSSKVVKVAGTLTYKGKPVPNATLFFEPEDGRQSWGETDKEGRFKLNYDPERDGAEIGKHKVYVMNRAEAPDNPGMPAPTTRELAEFYRKYSAANSKHTVEITASTTDLKLDLN
jgi:hypothetical protein